jgi:hypothetical protein
MASPHEVHLPLVPRVMRANAASTCRARGGYPRAVPPGVVRRLPRAGRTSVAGPPVEQGLQGDQLTVQVVTASTEHRPGIIDHRHVGRAAPLAGPGFTSERRLSAPASRCWRPASIRPRVNRRRTWLASPGPAHDERVPAGTTPCPPAGTRARTTERCWAVSAAGMGEQMTELRARLGVGPALKARAEVASGPHLIAREGTGAPQRSPTRWPRTSHSKRQNH